MNARHVIPVLVIGAIGMAVLVVVIRGVDTRPSGDKALASGGSPAASEAARQRVVASLDGLDVARHGDDLAAVVDTTLQVWSGSMSASKYVDELLARGGTIASTAVAMAEKRRSFNPDSFPSDEEWRAASDEQKVRAYFEHEWRNGAPVAALLDVEPESWIGDGLDAVRAAPPGYAHSQAMMARFLPPGLSHGAMQNAQDGVWLRVRARMNGHQGEHVIDLRFVHEPKSGRWFAAEVRVHGEPTKFNWAI